MKMCVIIGSALVSWVVLVSSGCSPLSGVEAGVKLVGDVVDHQEVEKREQQLIGQNPATADSILGQRDDTLRGVSGGREWLVYPVESDITDAYRWVIQVDNGRIDAVSMVQKNSSPEVDIPERLIYKDKTKGKSPSQCDEILKKGPAMVTARSENTGCLMRLYNAQMIKIKGVLKPHYMLLRFDDQDLCNDVELIAVDATSKDQSLDL